MALPDFFGRNAVAASQVLSGFNAERISETLSVTRVGIAFGADATDKAEGRALLDLLIRLLARLYPTISLRSQDFATASSIRRLATEINPDIEFADDPTVEVVVGTDVGFMNPGVVTIHVGATGWDAFVSGTSKQQLGSSDNPFGAGAGACLAAANVFRAVFLGPGMLDEACLSTFELSTRPSNGPAIVGASADLVLVGAGAIGNAAAWALARTDLDGLIRIVDHENVDLGNLQRYVLAGRRDEGAPKPQLLSAHFRGPLRAEHHHATLADFLSRDGYAWPAMLLALDNARDRRLAQSSLPHWIANAWTQPGDLGVSTHDFLGAACVSCLYLPTGARLSEDSVVAAALGIPDRLMEVRVLLYDGTGVPLSLLEAIGKARSIAMELLAPFEGVPIRKLYVEGFCGGAVIPLGAADAPLADVHVPLAHQSALAGVLLGATATRHALLGQESGTKVTRFDVLRRLPPSITQPARKANTPPCICQDVVYTRVYREKWAGQRLRL